MNTDEEQFELPPKVEGLLATLSRLYGKKDEKRLQEIVVNGMPEVHAEWTSDNWNGGTYGHAVKLTLPEELFLEILEDKEALQARLCKDANDVHSVQNEYIAEFFLESEVSENSQWRTASGLLRPRLLTDSFSADSLREIWDDEHVHVFFSHKAEFKKETSELKNRLKKYGIGCFVAHEDIEPTKEWQNEIETALQSMHTLVALLTADFHDSDWTDQEIGIALGTGVPVFGICLGKYPRGFIGKKQGVLECSWDNINGMAETIYLLLHKQLAGSPELFEAALKIYADPNSWDHSGWIVEHVLAPFEKLRPEQVERVIQAYQSNRENRHSFRGMGRLRPLLEKWTGDEWEIVENELRKKQPDLKPDPDPSPF